MHRERQRLPPARFDGQPAPRPIGRNGLQQLRAAGNGLHGRGRASGERGHFDGVHVVEDVAGAGLAAPLVGDAIQRFADDDVALVAHDLFVERLRQREPVPGEHEAFLGAHEPGLLEVVPRLVDLIGERAPGPAIEVQVERAHLAPGEAKRGEERQLHLPGFAARVPARIVHGPRPEREQQGGVGPSFVGVPHRRLPGISIGAGAHAGSLPRPCGLARARRAW